MACAMAAPLLEPSGDFSAWLEAQGVNAEVARAMDSELGIRDYGVLRACVGDGLVRAELLATARDRLPFGFYAVLRQVVKALQGADTHDGGTTPPCWDVSSPGDVTLGGLVDVLLALFSGLSRELLMSVQRLDDMDNRNCASSIPSAPRPKDGSLELDHDESEMRSIPAMGDTTPNNAGLQIKMEPLEDEPEEKPTPAMDEMKPSIAMVQIKMERLEGECRLDGRPQPIVQRSTSPSDLRTNLAHTAAARPYTWPQPDLVITHDEPEESSTPMMDVTIPNLAMVQIEMEPLEGECHLDGRPELIFHRANSPSDSKAQLVHTATGRPYASWPRLDAVEMHGEEIAAIPSSQTLTQQQQLAFAQRETIANDVPTNNGETSSILEDELFRFRLNATQPEISASKRHRCELCGKTYSLAFDLKRHMYVHTGTWPCRCKVCGHGVLRASDLKEHMRVHTGERPFCCNVCGQCFTRAWHLRSHERTHTGEKPHRCGMCGKSFTRSSGLRLHQRKHAADNS